MHMHMHEDIYMYNSNREYHAVIVSGMRQKWLLFSSASAAAVGPERSARTSPQGAPHAPDGEQAAPPAPGREARRAARVGTGAVVAVVLATGAAGSGRDGRRQVARRNVVEGHPPLRLRWQQVQPPVAGGRRPGGLAAEGVLRGPGGGHGVRGRQEPVHHGAAAGAGARLRRPRPGPPGRGVAEARGGAAVGGDAAGSVVAGERVVRAPRRGRGVVDDRREGRRRRLAAGADALGVTGSALPPEWHGHGAGSGAARGLRRRGGSRLLVGWQPRPRGRCLGTTVAPDGEERRGEIDAPVGVGHAHDWQPLSLRLVSALTELIRGVK
jgi:hypothetical protein